MEVVYEILKIILTGGITLVGVVIANNKLTALMEYRIGQLEKKVEKHNNIMERTYKLEEKTELQEAELNRHKERLKILENRG